MKETTSYIPAVEAVTIGEDSVWAVAHNGHVWAPIKKFCLLLGISPDAQRVKLTAKPWARTAMIAVRDSAGRHQETFAIRLDSLPMWLATIDPSRVEDSVVAKLTTFQLEAHDALARHFGLSGGMVSMQGDHDRASGGAPRSGGVPDTITAPMAPGSGSALQMLQMFDALSGALRASINEVAEVRALVQEHKAGVDMAIDVGTLALERANEAALVADRAARAGVQARESRRRIDAAVGTITSAIRQYCGKRGISYQSVYSAVRADLGLRRTQDGGPALGRAKLRADQVLRLAATATKLGVPGVGVAVITAILDGVDDPTRPGAIDAEVTSMTRVAARSAERTAP
jgi:hypothetical protein